MLIQTILKDFVRGFVRSDNFAIALEPFGANQAGAWDRTERPEAWVEPGVLPSLKLEDATVCYDAAARDPYITFWRKVALGALIVCGFAAAILACALRRGVPDLVVAGLCALVTGTLPYLVNTVCVVYMDRYALPLLISSVIGILACVASLPGWRRAGGVD